MPVYQYFIIGFALGLIAYLVIKNYLRFRKKNKPIPNIIFPCEPVAWADNLKRQHDIFILLNKEVVKRGRKPYKICYNIMTKAQGRVVEMDTLNQIDHKESRNEALELKIDGADGSADLINKYYRTPLTVVGREPILDKDGKVIRNGYGWFGSPLHKKAIMNPKYDYCGIGSLLRQNGRYIDDLTLVDEKTVN